MNENDIDRLLDIAKQINEEGYDRSYFDKIKSLKEVTEVVGQEILKFNIFDILLEDARKLNKSTVNKIFTHVDKLNKNLEDIERYIKFLRKNIKEKDKKSLEKNMYEYRERVIEGQGVCFDMITFLEFQDVIKNRINKLVNVLKEVEQHLIELFNKIEVDERKWLGETAENVEKETKTSQDEIDRLLKEFGL